MNICTIDLETYWDSAHSLTKMLPMAYCTHEDTDIISCAFKFNDDDTEVIFGEDAVINYCSDVDWSQWVVVGHNLAEFDAMILAWRLGVRPKLWACTLAMARPIHAKDCARPLGLAKLVSHYGLGYKDNTILKETKGRRLADFTDDEITRMRTYNAMDVDQTYALFKELIPQTKRREMQLIDMTIRMLVEPKFKADFHLLYDTLQAEDERKTDVLAEAGANYRKAIADGLTNFDKSSVTRHLLID